MEALFSPDYAPLWGLVLALLLFLPVRHLIWVLYMRRASKAAEIDEDESRRLRRRANVTSALLCFVFSMIYAHQLFR